MTQFISKFSKCCKPQNLRFKKEVKISCLNAYKINNYIKTIAYYYKLLLII